MDRTEFTLKKFYYRLTAYFPRKLPMNTYEFYILQDILMEYFGIIDREDIWLTLCGQVSSTQATKMRRSYQSLANACRRLDVNKTAKDIKTLYITQLEHRLKEATEKLVREDERESDPALSIGSLDFQRDLQIL